MSLLPALGPSPAEGFVMSGGAVARRYRVCIDQDSTFGVETDLEVTVSDTASREAIEGVLAETTRRILAAVFDEGRLNVDLKAE